MSFVTPWSGNLEEGTYKVVLAPNVQMGDDLYNFVQWEDGSINPTRTINLVSGLSISFQYNLAVTTALEIHVFLDGVPVIAEGYIVETGQRFSISETGAVIQVDPGTYMIEITVEGIAPYTTEVSVLSGQTIRIDAQMSTTPESPAPKSPAIFIAGGLLLLMAIS